jgi:hypothetical protein
MKKGILTLLFFTSICFIVYLIFRNINFQEGLENNTTTISNTAVGSIQNGIAGSAPNYAADIKSEAIKKQDILLITKYRKDYENIVMNVDDLINAMMLETTLSLDKKNPMKSLDKLVSLNSAKSALNNVMKYVDSSA